MKLKQTLISLTAIVLLAAGCNTNTQPQRLLPVYGPKQANGADTIFHTISDFELVNQDSAKVTLATLKGKIYVANFFFATCQSICPEMSNNLVEVQKEFGKDDSVLIVSHSVNPYHDTVQVLKAYASQYGAISGKWHLLTGNKKVIYDLAKTSYLVNAVEDDGTEEGFIHSEFFLLIDAKGRIRGTYDGTDKADVQKLIADIKLLKTEKASS